MSIYLQDAGLTWKYYAPGMGQSGYIWSALNAISHICCTISLTELEDVTLAA